MPAKMARHAPARITKPGNKKAKIMHPDKTRPARKATPPPRLAPKTKSAQPRSVSFSEKPKPKSTAKKDTKGKGKAVPSPMVVDEEVPPRSNLPTSFTVVAGSYEKLLYGLRGTITVEEDTHKFTLKPLFIFPAHISSIKTVSASPQGGKWLATGSADEIIKVWDLRRRKEIGGLMHHEGSITQLEFPSRSHLLSASEDGTLALFRARDWSVLRSLKGHKGRVNCVAVHPSGKVALSVGKDRTLRMWDLMRGKGSASTKLGKEGELVRWSSDGSIFIVQSFSSIDVFSTDMVLLHTLHHPSRIQDVRFTKTVDGKREVMMVAAEDKKVTVYLISEDKETEPTILAEMVGATNRVKAVNTLVIALPPLPTTPRESTIIASTISSDGKVRVYDLAGLPGQKKEEPPQLEPIAEYDTKGSRLTCMTLADGDAPSAPANGKRKRDDEDEDAEDNDEADDHMEEDDWGKEGEHEEEGESEEESEQEEEDEGEEE